MRLECLTLLVAKAKAAVVQADVKFEQEARPSAWGKLFLPLRLRLWFLEITGILRRDSVFFYATSSDAFQTLFLELNGIP